eukprot:TRINITY_DN1271_c0_g1_i1.p1 TRINITY_DN1271_c0_g1~~TRINITY_DN1271_c0_g1_i1.p1  ORF type:complete len:568 (+),score=81.90 TRINITY_DN1271_c0_g1_i1:263-1966(+)
MQFRDLNKGHSLPTYFLCPPLREIYSSKHLSFQLPVNNGWKRLEAVRKHRKFNPIRIVKCSASNDAYPQENLIRKQRMHSPFSPENVLYEKDPEPAYLPSQSKMIEGRIEKRQKKFKNKFLGLVRLGSVIDNAAESFFKSETRRRLCITVLLVVASRIGYFLPLPGFDRRLIPEDYLGFVSGSVEELGDLSAELKLSLFQLGISPHIFASIIMQVLCHVVPSLIKLRKEGLDGTEKIKSYIWWLSLATAFLESVVVSFMSLPYSIYSSTYRYQHVMATTFLLTVGSMITIWICEKISESGFGHGTSLIICVNILTGYSDTLYKIITRFSSGGVNWVPYIFMFLGVFIIVTMWAVIVTEGVRKVKLQYYAFKLAPIVREGNSLPEVEPYIPFNINPSGMQPVLTATYVLAIPGILARIFKSTFWGRARDMLNPTTVAAAGFKPLLYYTVNAFLIFSFNILDIANLPKEMADYIVKMGARIPHIKPGRATIEYLSKIQASTRFWGGLLLSLLATISTLMDHHFRHLNEGFSIGFTSILIIVGSIIELRRSYQAYNVMPTLAKVLRRYGV